MRDSMYHILLRTSALTLALVLLFDSGAFNPVTKQLSQNAQNYVATAVGVQAGVAPTELNQVTAALTERERDIAVREAAVQEREISIGLSGGVESTTEGMSTYILSVLLFIILVLIVLNYALDFARARRLSTLAQNEQRA